MTQSCWEFLGIEPTSDEKVIKKAYAALLKQNKPDKNPEGFKQLREAYDEALNQRFWYAPDEDELLEDILADESVADLQFDAKPLSASTLNTELKPIDYLQGDRLTHFSPVTTINDVQPVDNTDVSHDNNTQDAYGYEIPSANHLYTSKNGDIIDDIGFGNVDLDDEDLTAWTNLWQAQDDHQLAKVLQTQFAELDNQSLDFVHDYELELLQFLAYDDEPLVMSYKASFDYFNWQQYLNSWQAEQYPWSMLNHLHERYQYWEKFLPTDIDSMLLKNYPEIYEYWRLKCFNRFNFFIRLKNAVLLADELNQLNNQLALMHAEYASKGSNNPFLRKIQLFQDDNRLNTLNRWVFDKIFTPVDISMLIFIVALIAPLLGLLFGDIYNMYVNMSVMLIGVVIFLAFWQFTLFLVVKPEKLTIATVDSKKNVVQLLISTLLYICLYLIWSLHNEGYNIALDQTSYFAAHLAGMLSLGILIYGDQQKIPFLTRLTVSRGLILFLIAVLIPIIVLNFADVTTDQSLKIKTISPLFWCLFAMPSVLSRFFSYDFLIKIAYWISTYVGFVMGAYLLILLFTFFALGLSVAGVGLFLICLWHFYWLKTEKFLA